MKEAPGAIIRAVVRSMLWVMGCALRMEEGWMCGHSSGCEKQARGNGMCSVHGGVKKCRHASGCKTNARNKGLCRVHGGGGMKCRHTSGCKKNARVDGLCFKHGGGTKWKHASGCNKVAEQGNVHGVWRRKTPQVQARKWLQEEC